MQPPMLSLTLRRSCGSDSSESQGWAAAAEGNARGAASAVSECAQNMGECGYAAGNLLEVEAPSRVGIFLQWASRGLASVGQSDGTCEQATRPPAGHAAPLGPLGRERCRRSRARHLCVSRGPLAKRPSHPGVQT